MDCFDSSLIDYKRTDKNVKSLTTQLDELLAQDKELDNYIATHGLSMLAHDEIQNSLSLILCSISVDVDNQAEKDVLKKANPLFIETLTLKGPNLTRVSYNFVGSEVLNLSYLTSLSLEFDPFDPGILGAVLSRLIRIHILGMSASRYPLLLPLKV